MGTTTHGLPYPEPTDPVANGAAAIRSLAETADTQIFAQVAAAGDTMTGPLIANDVIIPGGPAAGGPPKFQVDRRVGNWSTDWSNAGVIITNAAAAGTNRTAGISGLNPGANGPQIRVTEGMGERWDFNTTAGSGYASIAAAAFTVASSETIKTDIAPATVLAKVALLHASRYRLAQTLDCARVIDDDGNVELFEHDCSVDACNGTADAPCCAKRNHDSPQYGLIAEEVLTVFPEAVSLGLDLRPDGIHVNQIAAIALGAVAELLAKVTALEDEVTALRSAP